MDACTNAPPSLQATWPLPLRGTANSQKLEQDSKKLSVVSQVMGNIMILYHLNCGLVMQNKIDMPAQKNA